MLRYLNQPLAVIRLNACRVKNISFVRLKIAVGSTPSSLYISKPLHSGTSVLQILPFHLRISPASPYSTSDSLSLHLPFSTRCFSLHTLARKAIWICRYSRISPEIPATGQILFSEGLKSCGRRARRPEIDRLHSDVKLPPMP